MDSFVLSETFKYLYLIFSEPGDLIFDPDNFVLTTEAHFLPLHLGDSKDNALPRRLMLDPDEKLSDAALRNFRPVFPFQALKTKEVIGGEARAIREKTQGVLEELTALQRGGTQRAPQAVCAQMAERLRAQDFSPSNPDHIKQLEDMGITISSSDDNRLLLTHSAANAANTQYARMGLAFMQEMQELAEQGVAEGQTAADRTQPIHVQIISQPHIGAPILLASLAQFGSKLLHRVHGLAVLADPLRACTKLRNWEETRGRIVVVERSDCMFVEKARNVQDSGAIGIVVVDHTTDSSWDGSQPFSMSGEPGKDDDVHLPTVFLFRKEGWLLIKAITLATKPPLIVLGREPVLPGPLFASWLRAMSDAGERQRRLNEAAGAARQMCTREDGLVVRLDWGEHGESEEEEGRDAGATPALVLGFRFGPVSTDSEPIEHQGIVERHINHVEDVAEFDSPEQRSAFLNLIRSAGYTALGLSVKVDDVTPEILEALRNTRLEDAMPASNSGLTGRITRVRCTVVGGKVPCEVVPGA